MMFQRKSSGDNASTAEGKTNEVKAEIYESLGRLSIDRFEATGRFQWVSRFARNAKEIARQGVSASLKISGKLAEIGHVSWLKFTKLDLRRILLIQNQGLSRIKIGTLDCMYIGCAERDSYAQTYALNGYYFCGMPSGAGQAQKENL
jgi:hypothetical protein